GTGAAAVAGTVTAAAPAPDAGVAGGLLLVGDADAGGAVAGADRAAAPVAAATGATAAPAPEALTAAAAPSTALCASDRPAWASAVGDTVTPACAVWGRAIATSAITITLPAAPESSRPRLTIG
ncbi:MAG: hypothetical protein ACXVRW_12895, partial [Solirubrobacteraceae bacterium]